MDGDDNRGWQVVRLSDDESVLAPSEVEGLKGMFTPYDYDSKSGRVAGSDGRSDRLCVWEKSGKLIAALPGEHRAEVATFANSGKTLFTLNHAGIARLWDLTR